MTKCKTAKAVVKPFIIVCYVVAMSEQREGARTTSAERYQREGYTYEWVHTHLQREASDPSPPTASVFRSLIRKDFI